MGIVQLLPTREREGITVIPVDELPPRMFRGVTYNPITQVVRDMIEVLSVGQAAIAECPEGIDPDKFKHGVRMRLVRVNRTFTDRRFMTETGVDGNMYVKCAVK